jgi:hypothetical protein
MSFCIHQVGTVEKIKNDIDLLGISQLCQKNKASYITRQSIGAFRAGLRVWDCHSLKKIL